MSCSILGRDFRGVEGASSWTWRRVLLAVLLAVAAAVEAWRADGTKAAAREVEPEATISPVVTAVENFMLTMLIE